MTFWQWFQRDGDKVFTFVALASVALKGVDGLAPWVSQAALVAGLLATAAPQSFFPTQPAAPAQPEKP